MFENALGGTVDGHIMWPLNTKSAKQENSLQSHKFHCSTVCILAWLLNAKAQAQRLGNPDLQSNSIENLFQWLLAGRWPIEVLLQNDGGVTLKEKLNIEDATVTLGDLQETQMWKDWQASLRLGGHGFTYVILEMKDAENLQIHRLRVSVDFVV